MQDALIRRFLKGACKELSSLLLCVTHARTDEHNEKVWVSVFKRQSPVSHIADSFIVYIRPGVTDAVFLI